MKEDITDLLQAWTFDPEANVRRIEGEDGIEKIQVRIDQAPSRAFYSSTWMGDQTDASRTVMHSPWTIFAKR